MTFPIAIMQFNFSTIETILWTNIGGILGIYFFAFLSDKVILWWKRTFRAKKSRAKSERTEKKIFTKKNRRIIKIKQRYGLIGIALATPFLLSIPVGTFLLIRYYRTSRVKLIYLIGSNLIWSIIYTLFYTFWDGLLFKQV